MAKRCIRELSQKQLEEMMISFGEKPFRGRQLFNWLWVKQANSFDAMTDISNTLREKLNNTFSCSAFTEVEAFESTDKTVKYIFHLLDGEKIEGVLIPSKERATACISSQIGCALGCKFCATGGMGFTRDLKANEISEQVIYINAESIKRNKIALTNIVYMGMGEPLLNYDEVKTSVIHLTDKNMLGLSSKRITLSTVGIVPGIKQLADDRIKANLAISLHSAVDLKRKSFMPIANKYSLSELHRAIKYYYEQTGLRVTYEYLLLQDINDSIDDARAFADFCKVSPCKINLIEYNATNNRFKKSPADNLEGFKRFMEGCNIPVQIRRSRGADIAAACGQLITKK